MSSVLTSVNIELRIYKYLNDNPKAGWGNTYEIHLPDFQLADAENAAVIAQAIAEAEADIHLDRVVYDRAVVASWQEDGHPYDPLSFVTVPLSLTGQRSTVGQKDLGMDTVVNFRRVPALGRSGKLAFRQSIGSNDLTDGGAGQMVLASGSATALAALGATLYTTINDVLDEVLGPGGSLAMISPYDGPPTVREVQNILLKGPGVNKFNHKWFNRLTPP